MGNGMTIDVERRYREALEQARDRLQSISAHVHPLDEMTESDLHSISQDWWFGTQEIETTLDRAVEYGTPASQETALREVLANDIETIEARYLDDDGDGYGGVPFVSLNDVLVMVRGAALAPKEADHG